MDLDLAFIVCVLAFAATPSAEGVVYVEKPKYILLPIDN
jgi:hypothetical protein